MEKERGMEEPQATPALQEFPQLQRLAMFSPATQGLIADYLAYLRARHYTPSVQEGTIRALKSFAVLMPAARQSVLYRIFPPFFGQVSPYKPLKSLVL